MSTISPTRSSHDHGTKADADVAPGEIAVGVVIGRASEYFDFFVFGIASLKGYKLILKYQQKRTKNIHQYENTSGKAK